MTFIFFRLWLFGTWETWSWNCTRSNRIKTKYFKFSGRPIMKRFWLLRVPIGAYTSGTCPKSERSNRLKTLKMAHPSCWSVLNLYILFTLIVIYTFICCLFVFVFLFFFCVFLLSYLFSLIWFHSSSMAVTRPKSLTFRGTLTNPGSSAPFLKITSCRFGKWPKTYIMTKNRKRRLLNWKTPHNDLLLLIYHSQITHLNYSIPPLFPRPLHLCPINSFLGIEPPRILQYLLIKCLHSFPLKEFSTMWWTLHPVCKWWTDIWQHTFQRLTFVHASCLSSNTYQWRRWAWNTSINH